MIPFVEQPTASVGPFSIDAFTTLVATAVIVGVLLSRRRCVSTGLDPTVGERMAWFIVAVGLVTSHVVDVLAYHPDWVARDPAVLLRVWGSHSSFGGFLGGILGVAIYRPRSSIPFGLRERLAYLDVYAWAFPVSWIFGRLGCTLALDHPGAITRFPLATSLESPAARAFLRNVYAEAGRLSELPSDAVLASFGFHNLGFYELVYTVLVIVPTMLVLGKRPRAPGFFLATFLLVYSPIRFLADFLRVGDRTYAGLTFGQYAAIGLTIVSAYAMARSARDKA